MGECNFYLKARFRTAKRAQAAMPRLTALLAEGEAAYRYWQDNRRYDAREEPTSQSASQFWAGFRQQFPLVCVYLAELDGIEDWNNGLAGNLGPLVDPQRERRWAPNASLVCRDKMLLLQLNGIWHCTDMMMLERFCIIELDALAVGSISEERFEGNVPGDPFGFIRV